MPGRLKEVITDLKHNYRWLTMVMLEHIIDALTNCGYVGMRVLYVYPADSTKKTLVLVLCPRPPHNFIFLKKKYFLFFIYVECVMSSKFLYLSSL